MTQINADESGKPALSSASMCMIAAGSAVFHGGALW